MEETDIVCVGSVIVTMMDFIKIREVKHFISAGFKLVKLVDNKPEKTDVGTVATMPR